MLSLTDEIETVELGDSEVSALKSSSQSSNLARLTNSDAADVWMSDELSNQWLMIELETNYLIYSVEMLPVSDHG